MFSFRNLGGALSQIIYHLNTWLVQYSGGYFIVILDSYFLWQDKVCAAGEHAITSKKVDVKRAKAKPGKIFIGGLKPELTDEMIREYFGAFGNIIEFEMPIDKVTKVRKGFGFITFEKEDTMKDLVRAIVSV